MSSVCSRPAWWASASRATHCDGGGEQDPVPGLAGADRDADRQVGLAGAGRAEEHHVVLGGDEVQRAEVGDDVAFEAAGVVEVELLQRLAGREPGGADAALAAVGFAGGDLALQAGGEELLMGPGLGPGPFGEPGDRLTQRGGFQRPGEERQLRGHVPAARLCRRPSRHPAVDAERGVVVGQAPDLRRPARPRGGRLRAVCGAAARAAATCSGSVMRLVSGPGAVVARRPAGPSQNTRTRCRSAMTSIRRPITAGCTE